MNLKSRYAKAFPTNAFIHHENMEILYIPEIRGPFDLTQKAYTAMMTPGKFHVHENSQMVIYISSPAKVDTHPVL